MAHFFLEILGFQFLHVFPSYFNIFAICFFVCKCALVSFYTYFQRILTILQISFIFQTPPRPPRGPPQDLPGTPPGPSRTPRGPSRTRADGVGPYSWFRLVKYSRCLQGRVDPYSVQTHQWTTNTAPNTNSHRGNAAARRNARSG